jgi:hypothetical protein
MHKISTDVQDDYDLPPVLPMLSPKKIKSSTCKAGARATEKAGARATEKAAARATQKAGARALGFSSSTDTEVSWFDSSPQGFKRMTSAESRCVIC